MCSADRGGARLVVVAVLGVALVVGLVGVVWLAKDPYSGIGVNVTTRTVFLTKEVASSYSGGGMDPTATFEKEELIPTDFGSQHDALAALCAQLSDVRMWPMGTGMHGVWRGKAHPLGDSVTCPAP